MFVMQRMTVARGGVVVIVVVGALVAVCAMVMVVQTHTIRVLVRMITVPVCQRKTEAIPCSTASRPPPHHPRSEHPHGAPGRVAGRR